MRNIIGITMGDPKGIGPEIIAKALKELSADERARFCIYGDQNILSAAENIRHSRGCKRESSDKLISDTDAARMALTALNKALEDINAGKISALITAPVNKHRMQCMDPLFVGHTEYLASAAKVKNPVMMFFAEGFPCVSLVTTHLAISEVPRAITKERVLVTIERTNEALKRYFARPAPKIAVLALNPHAGEGGSIGHEEREIIAPAIELAKKQGIDCDGPFPADSIFKTSPPLCKGRSGGVDAIIAMYHDQALIPLKLLYPDTCVNITLGLPYIRTSPGHGTAEDIAWRGQANAQNMLATMRLTLKLASQA